MSHSFRGRVAGSERVFHGMSERSRVMNDSGMRAMGPEDMADFSHNVVMSSNHVSLGGSDSVTLDKTVFVHNAVQFMDHLVGLGGSMSNDRVELVHKSVMSDEAVHLVDLHL